MTGRSPGRRPLSTSSMATVRRLSRPAWRLPRRATTTRRVPYTPGMAGERYTGVSRKTVIKFAREFAENAEATNGRCTVIIGAGINHWYHNNLIYRGPTTGLMLTGSVGVRGGGLAHYVGQEKLAPVSAWSAIAFATTG